MLFFCVFVLKFFWTLATAGWRAFLVSEWFFTRCTLSQQVLGKRKKTAQAASLILFLLYCTPFEGQRQRGLGTTAFCMFYLSFVMWINPRVFNRSAA